MPKQKFYAYVDESGQDTKGVFFVVGVLVTEKERESVSDMLERIEVETHKGSRKWHRASHTCRKAYIERLLGYPVLRDSLFYEVFSDDKKYIELTAYATAKALLRRVKGEYEATIYVDGLRKRELELFTRGLRDLRVKKRKVRGVKRDENDACIRLADALCGLVRDTHEGNTWASDAIRKLQQKRIVIAL